jgi:hypothetical protein
MSLRIGQFPFRAVGLSALCLALGGLFPGCGGGGDNSSGDIEGLRIEQYQSDVRFFCTSGKGDLAGTSDPLGTMLTAVDNLIKVYKDDPNATYTLAKIANTGDKLGPRTVKIGDLLKESAATLDKNCGRYGPDQAARLRATVGA